MKRNTTLFAAMICAGAMLLSSCGTMGAGAIGSSTPQTNTGSSSTKSTTESVLGSLLGTLIGNSVPVNEKNIVGTWTYSSPEVRFESEGFLSKAGGEVAAAKIEQNLTEMYAKIGVTPGSSSFTFNADKTCTIRLGSKTINGTYTVDPSTNSLNIVSSTGLIKLNGKVYFGLNSLAILFDSNKILTIAQTLATFTGQSNSTLGALAGALNQYQGLMLGMNLSK